MLFLDELEDSCSNRTAVLICGSPSAVRDLHQSKWAGADLVSINQHGLIIPNLSWVFSHDQRMVEHLISEKIPCPIVSHHRELLREQDIHGGSVPYVRLSGPEAVWVADFLGYQEIWLCGVDSYQNTSRDYWHQYIPKDKDLSLKTHKPGESDKAWREIAEKLKHPERIHTFNKQIQTWLCKS